jgi:DNA polymerase-3 subunit delta'
MVPDPELSTDTLGIWSVRQAKRFLSLRSATGRKVLLIDDAERLTREAGNAFLKALEEPPPGTVIFIVVEHMEALLPTIRSRAMQVPFRLVSDAVIRENISDEDTVVALAHGRPGQAKRLLEDAELRSALKRREAAAQQLIYAPRITRLAYAARAEAQAPDALGELPGQWLLALRDTVRNGDAAACALVNNLFFALQQLSRPGVRQDFVLNEALVAFDN